MKINFTLEEYRKVIIDKYAKVITNNLSKIIEG